jgi:hypothetical protein
MILSKEDFQDFTLYDEQRITPIMTEMILYLEAEKRKMRRILHERTASFDEQEEQSNRINQWISCLKQMQTYISQYANQFLYESITTMLAQDENMNSIMIDVRPKDTGIQYQSMLRVPITLEQFLGR